MNLLTAIASGILYRMGGASGYDTKFRDLGLPAVMVLTLWPDTWPLAIAAFFCFGISFGALTMGYGGEGEPREDQSPLYRIFKKNVFFALGFIYGIAAFPWPIITGNWAGFLLRTLILTFGIPAIAWYSRPVWKWDKAQVEEWARGFLFNITLFFL